MHLGVSTVIIISITLLLMYLTLFFDSLFFEVMCVATSRFSCFTFQFFKILAGPMYVCSDKLDEGKAFYISYYVSVSLHVDNCSVLLQVDYCYYKKNTA